MFTKGNGQCSLEGVVTYCLGTQPFGGAYLGPDGYRKPLLRKRIIWFHIMLFIRKLWQSTLRNEMHCNL